MKIKTFLLVSFMVISCLSQTKFLHAQITYPCGKYFIELNGTSNGGLWNQAFNSNDITLATWVQITPSTIIGQPMALFSRYDFNTSEDTDFWLYINEEGKFVFQALVIDATGSKTRESLIFDLNPIAGTWYHIAVTFNGTSHQCNGYVNGELNASKGFSGPLSYVTIGSAFSKSISYGAKYWTQRGGFFSQYFKGYLDEAVYASKELSADAIKTLAKGVVAGDPFISDNSIIIYHKFDDYPSMPNYGVSGGSLPMSVGVLHICPTTLTTAIIDPNPSMIIDNGKLNTDQSKINLKAKVSGAVTDGVTKLLLLADADVPVTFSLPDPKDGALYSLDEQGTLTTQISIEPKNGKAVCVYEVPDGYGINNPVEGRNITVKAYYTSDNSHLTNINIHLITPPVVLVHGMWSGPSVWFEGNFVKILSRFGYTYSSNNLRSIYLVDYSSFGASTFDPLSPNSIYGRRAVQHEISTALANYRNNKIAISQVDVVGHSLGGLMARSFSQQDSSYYTKENYKHGYIHKLITLGTPFKGSPFGPLVYSKRDVKVKIPIYYTDLTKSIPLVDILSFFNKPIGDCHRDFDKDGPAIQNNLLAINSMKTYSIGGNYKGGISNQSTYAALNEFIKIISGKTHAGLFQLPGCITTDEPSNDIIVPMYSQMGGNKKGKIFSGTSHLSISPFESSETNSPEIQTAVIQLLYSDQPSDFNGGFIKASEIKDDCDAPIVTNRNLSTVSNNFTKASRKFDTSAQNQAVQIVSPTRGLTIQENSTASLTLQYQVLNGAIPSDAMFMIKNVGWFTAPTVPPYSISVTLPDSIAIGNLNIVLFAKDTTGVIMADTSSIIITPNGDLDSISVNPSGIFLDSTLRIASFNVQGYYSAGQSYNEADITNISAGTTYGSQKGNSIFIVSQNGKITAVSPGTDTLIVSNSGHFAKLPVTVDSNFAQITMYNNGIDFPPIPDKSLTDAPFVLVANDSAAESVVFSLISGPVTLQNGVVTINGTGIVTIEATSPGNAYFTVATPVYRTFRITNALPLTLLNVTGFLNNNQVNLTWQTAQEINTSHFIIERSEDGEIFSSIGRINVAGNSLSAKNYSFIDSKPLQGVNYYRLKMVDRDGKFTYSKIIAVKYEGNNNSFKIFPNPANDILYVRANGEGDFATLQIFDASGRKLREEKVALNHNTSYPINIKNLPKGIYNLLLQNKTINEHQKFVKE